MPSLTQVIYTSRALKRFTASEVDELARIAAEGNEKLGITGVLLYGGGRFLQLLEGEHQAIEDLFYKRIIHDPRHIELTVLLKEESDIRLLPNWSMGRLYLQDNELSALQSWDALCAEIVRQSPQAMFSRNPAVSCIDVFVSHFSDELGSANVPIDPEQIDQDTEALIDLLNTPLEDPSSRARRAG